VEAVVKEYAHNEAELAERLLRVYGCTIERHALALQSLRHVRMR
jgi:hypothetical protein